MRHFLVLVAVLFATVVLAAPVFKPLVFGQKVTIGQARNRDGGLEFWPDSGPHMVTKWDGDFQWMTIARDDNGDVNIITAICKEANPANPEALAAGIQKTCEPAQVETVKLTPDEAKTFKKLYKMVVLKKKLVSGD